MSNDQFATGTDVTWIPIEGNERHGQVRLEFWLNWAYCRTGHAAEGRALYLGQRFHAASKDLVVAQEQLAKRFELSKIWIQIPGCGGSFRKLQRMPRLRKARASAPQIMQLPGVCKDEGILAYDQSKANCQTYIGHGHYSCIWLENRLAIPTRHTSSNAVEYVHPHVLLCSPLQK